MQQKDLTETIHAYLNVGNQLEKEGKLTQAFEQYQQALHLDPDCLLALSQIAEIYKRTRRFSQAIIYYKKILRLQPHSAKVQTQLARAILDFGDTPRALLAYQKALNK
jgi:tetratricopeptide (TPR) repeat protein